MFHPLHSFPQTKTAACSAHSCDHLACIEQSGNICPGNPRPEPGSDLRAATKAAAQIGMVACNDYILLESCIYRMLQLNLGDHPSYAKLLELFHEVRNDRLPALAVRGP